MGISLTELPILEPVKPAWLNKFGFWLSVLQLMFLYLGTFGLSSERKTLILQAAAKTFPTGSDNAIADRCARYLMLLLFMPHIVAKAAPGFVVRVQRD